MKAKSHKVLRHYVDASGETPFLDWLHKLKDKVTRARIRRRLDLLETGHYGDHKPLGDGAYELRLHFGPGYRIYFAEVACVIVILLYGGDKSSQAKNIKTAKKFWKELQEQCHEQN